MDVMEQDKHSIKKWLTAKRNKRDLLMKQLVEGVQDEQERLREREEERKKRDARISAAAGASPDSPWMAKAHEARNRLTDQKRASAERWNRFAGTMDGGGRGL